MLDRLFESHDLTTLHTLLSLLGVGLALYVMQLTSREHEDGDDPVWVQWGHRLGLSGLALAFLWSLMYSNAKAWQPWPPTLAIEFAIVMTLVIRAVAIHARVAREGPRPGSVAALELSKRKVR